MTGLEPQVKVGIIFREIPGFPGYYATTDGRIYSTRQVAKKKGWIKQLNQFTHANGYKYVGLRVDGKTGNQYIHRLILLTFVGPCPEGMEACHLDGSRANNHVDNLRWDTRLNNIRDKFDHGTMMKGSQCPIAKLTEDIVREARREFSENGTPVKVLAQRYGITPGVMVLALKGITWKHV
jgi:hypothetical protein